MAHEMIRNREELTQVRDIGDRRTLREKLLSIIDGTLKRLRPSEILRERVLLRKQILIIRGINGEAEFDLSKYNRIAILAFGKASLLCWRYLSQLLSDILKEKLYKGLVVFPKGTELADLRLDVNQEIAHKVIFIASGHPLPDEDSLRAGRLALEIAEALSEGDLMIALISGGGSALLEYPEEPISLDDLRRTYDIVMRGGATINELNALRRAISKVKGGKLAKAAEPAQVVSVILSDVINSPLHDIASGPTAPNPTSDSYVLNSLKRLGVWDQLPESVKIVLGKGRPTITELKRASNLVVADNRLNTIIASEVASKYGLRAFTLTNSLEGEAREVGKALGSILRDVKTGNSSLKPPLVILSSGETTVKVMGSGQGGRNQELALGVAMMIKELKGVAFASLGTDGIDGKSPSAGGLVDGYTLLEAEEMGLSLEDYLRENDSYNFLKPLRGAIITGPTGTNFMDLQIGLVV